MVLSSLLPEREPECDEKGWGLLVGPGCGADCYVHAPCRVDAVVVDLGEDQLFVHSERVVAVTVERPRREPTEVADPRDRKCDEPVQELPSPVATHRHLHPDVHPLTELETGDRLSGACDQGFLAGDHLEVTNGALDQ